MNRQTEQTGVAVELHGVGRIFPGPLIAIDSVDLRVQPGQFLAILGPSGCGKSTLLRLIAGLDKPSFGSVCSGHSTSARRDIAYVFQDAHLLPWRNVLRNVALPLELAGVSRAKRLAEAEQAIRQVGLADAMTLYPAQLSGGMRMRVSLARALITRPKLLLLDEPFAALDEITRQQLDQQLYCLWLDRRMTVIFVTHSIMEATFLAQRVIVLSRRPARIVLDHMLDLPQDRDQSLRTDPRFVDQMRLLLKSLDQTGATS